MKHIIIPASLPFGEKPFSFRDTVTHIIDTDPVFCRPASNARAAQRLLEALERAEAHKDPVWTIGSPEDLKLLQEAAERWVCGIHGTVNGQPKELPLRVFLPHLDAIAEARVNDPRAELPKPTETETASAN